MGPNWKRPLGFSSFIIFSFTIRYGFITTLIFILILFFSLDMNELSSESWHKSSPIKVNIKVFDTHLTLEYDSKVFSTFYSKKLCPHIRYDFRNLPLVGEYEHCRYLPLVVVEYEQIALCILTCIPSNQNLHLGTKSYISKWNFRILSHVSKSM